MRKFRFSEIVMTAYNVEYGIDYNNLFLFISWANSIALILHTLRRLHHNIINSMLLAVSSYEYYAPLFTCQQGLLD